MANNFIGLKRIGQNKKAMDKFEENPEEKHRFALANFSKRAPEKTSVKEQLRAMGHFFEIDPKKINFYIKQLELSGKI